jgi:thiamine biosynthesis protein ThiS
LAISNLLKGSLFLTKADPEGSRTPLDPRGGPGETRAEMGIVVNKETRDWVEGETVSRLLLRMKYTYPLVAVKINGRLVPKSKYERQTIPDNSTVEVVHLMSGG